MRLATSGIFVGANILASFAIIVLVTRNITSDERTIFFLFQAVFFPVTTLLSQTSIIMRFRATKTAVPAYLLDGAVALIALACLRAITAGNAQVLDLLFYALSIPMAYRGATAMASIQYQNNSNLSVIIPLSTAILRLLVCFWFLDLGPALSFFGASVVYFAVPALSALRLEQRLEPEPVNRSNGDFLTFLAFFFVASLTFQWDRILLVQLDSSELIVAAGVYVTWLLSPISTIFATIYRADAKNIFGSSGTMELSAFYRHAGIFVGLAFTYIVMLAMGWNLLNTLLFPYFSSGFTTGLILAVAIVVDRIGTLIVFMANDGAMYRRASLLKGLSILGAVTVVWYLSPITEIRTIYSVVLIVLVCHVGLVWLFCRQFKQ